ncbi:MAG: hypothetical protein U7126_17460 [Microcoleus sp.]
MADPKALGPICDTSTARPLNDPHLERLGNIYKRVDPFTDRLAGTSLARQRSPPGPEFALPAKKTQTSCPGVWRNPTSVWAHIGGIVIVS